MKNEVKVLKVSQIYLTERLYFIEFYGKVDQIDLICAANDMKFVAYQISWEFQKEAVGSLH